MAPSRQAPILYLRAQRDARCGSGIAEQVTWLTVVVDSDVEVDGRGQEAGMARGNADLGQSTGASQGVADKRVPAVVNGQRPQALSPEALARGPEPPAQAMAPQRPAEAARLEATDEGVLRCGSLLPASSKLCTFAALIASDRATRIAAAALPLTQPARFTMACSGVLRVGEL